MAYEEEEGEVADEPTEAEPADKQPEPDGADLPAWSLELRKTVEEQVAGLPEELERKCTQHVAEAKTGFLQDTVLFCDRITSYFESIQQETLELLSRAGLQPLVVEGNTFNPSLQKVVGTEVTDREELHGTVASVVRRGYRFEDGRVFRPEEVVVFKKEESGDA